MGGIVFWLAGVLLTAGAGFQGQVEPDPGPPAVIDLRGVWIDAGLDKKKAAERGLDAKAIRLPTKIRHVNPRYPDEARRARVEGAVILECRIETDGVPQDCKVHRGLAPLAPSLDAEAIRCVGEWRFKPLTLHGEPRPALVYLGISFRR